MSCSVSCGTGTSCSSGCGSNQDLDSIIDSILTRLIEKVEEYDEESVDLLSQYLTQGDYASLCKLNSIWEEFQTTNSTSNYFLLLKFFIKHEIKGILVCFALDSANSFSSFIQIISYSYHCFIGKEEDKGMVEEVHRFIDCINNKLQEYLIFHPNSIINKAIY